MDGPINQVQYGQIGPPTEYNVDRWAHQLFDNRCQYQPVELFQPVQPVYTIKDSAQLYNLIAT